MSDKKHFVIVWPAPGADVFIRDARGNVTDRVEEAERYTYGEDNPVIKAQAFNRLTGLDTFEARAV